MKNIHLKRMAAVIAAICILFAGMQPAECVKASSASISFSSDNLESEVGDMLKVMLTLEAEVVPGEFEGFISYDSDVIEYEGGPDCISGAEGMLKITDRNITSETNTRKYVLYFRAVGRGYSELTMIGTPELYEADQGYLMSVSSNSITLMVNASAKASSDSSLATLRISPGTLEPAFMPSVYEYSTTVPYETEKLFISAMTNDSKASVKIDGQTSLNVGQNRILIVVTAENGNESKYVIYCVRDKEAAQDITPAAGTEDAGDGTEDGTESGLNGEEDTDDAGNADNPDGWYFYAEEKDGELFLTADTRYKICATLGDLQIPDGYFKTSVIISGNNVVVFSPKSDLSSDFLLMVLQKEGCEPALYSYDRVEKTVQRYYVDINARTQQTASGYATYDEAELKAGYEKTLGILTVVIAGLCGVCMLLLIITIRQALKKRESER